MKYVGIMPWLRVYCSVPFHNISFIVFLRGGRGGLHICVHICSLISKGTFIMKLRTALFIVMVTAVGFGRVRMSCQSDW